ncbi:MAG TPA: hypothetical protein VGG39_17815 [Polyangiaceae bacterium]|jgi:hypothetical protein
MPDDPRASAPDRDAFEAEERPTRPAPPPQEHLRLLRRTPAPPRGRPAARRRPSLTAVAKKWVSAPSTTTSRWRAIAATVLGGGAGRASLVDPGEKSAAPALVPAPALAPTPAPALATLKMSPPPVIELPGDADDGSLLDVVGDAHRRVVRRGVIAACVLLLGAWSVWFVLRGHLRAPPAAEAAASSAAASARPPLPSPLSPSLSPAPAPSAATAPSSHELPAAAPSHRGRRRLSPGETSEIL